MTDKNKQLIILHKTMQEAYNSMIRRITEIQCTYNLVPYRCVDIVILFRLTAVQ